MDTRTALGRDAEWHHNVKVIRIADDLDDTWRERAAELDRDFRRAEATEGVGDEPRVERDRRVLSLDRRVDLRRLVSHLGCVRADDDRGMIGWIHLEAQHVRRVL